MTPLARQSTQDTLGSIKFTTVDDAQRNGQPSLPPIVVEGDAFMSWWRPNWRERIKLLFGGPVRVVVNYSLHGPLAVDTEAKWGDGERPD
jgi:hypothetical protein